MSDELHRKAECTAIALAETGRAFEGVRAALVERMLATPMEASLERERIYLAVQVLDAVRARMRDVIAGDADDKAIEEFVASMRG